MKETDICPLCDRPIPSGCGTEHHLVPKLKGGLHGEKKLMHRICHSKIHSYFTETELAKSYNTVDRLLEHEEIRRFVRWVRTKPDGFSASNRSHKRKR